MYPTKTRPIKRLHDVVISKIQIYTRPSIFDTKMIYKNLAKNISIVMCYKEKNE